MYDAYDDEDSGILPAPVAGSPQDQKIKQKDELMSQLQAALNKDNSKEAENELLNIVQKNRQILLDVATNTFLSKPNNPKLLDAINSLMGALEKSVRDDRKERLKDRELEDNKAKFANFVNALNEISAGKLVLPTYGDMALVLDPMQPLVELDKQNAIKDGELEQGRIMLDPKEIEASLNEE